MATEVALGNYLAKIESLTPVQSNLGQVVKAEQGSIIESGWAGFSSGTLLFLGVVLVVMVGLLIASLFRLVRVNNSMKLMLMILLIPVSLVVVERQVQYQSKAGPDEVPTAVGVYQNEEVNTWVVEWRTRNATDGGVRLSLDPEMDPVERVYLDQAGRKSEHTVELKSLEVGKIYYMQILSEGEWYDNAGVPVEIKLRE